MNSKMLLIILTTVFVGSIHAQYFNQVVIDTALKKEIIIGYCDRDMLGTFEEFAPFYAEEYAIYEPSQEIINDIKKINTDDHSILIIMATWCHDSKEQVPRFLKILDETGFNEKKLVIVAVNRQKTAGEISISDYDIELVPTFIFYNKKEELGRIIETPENTLESDFLNIIK